MERRLNELSLDTIKKMVKSNDASVRSAAILAAIDNDQIPLSLIMSRFGDPDIEVRRAAVNAYKSRGIDYNYIARMQRSTNPSSRITALEICYDDKNIPTSIIERGLKDTDSRVSKVASKLFDAWLLDNKSNPQVINDFLISLLKKPNEVILRSALSYMIANPDIPFGIVLKYFEVCQDAGRGLSSWLTHDSKLSYDEFTRLLNVSKDPCTIKAILDAITSNYADLVDIKLITRYLEHKDEGVQESAINCFIASNPSVATIESFVKHSGSPFLIAAMKASFKNPDVHYAAISPCLHSANVAVKNAAILACEKRDFVSSEMLDSWLSVRETNSSGRAVLSCVRDTSIIRSLMLSGSVAVRLAAVECYTSRIKPSTTELSAFDKEIILLALDDTDYDIRRLVLPYVQNNKLSARPYRTFDPPEHVYAKCLGGVIAVLSIPDDAIVCGNPSRDPYTNKAKITNIIGTVGGEKIAIFGNKNNYRIFDISDEIVISDERFNAFGPHTPRASIEHAIFFYTTLEQAKSS